MIKPCRVCSGIGINLNIKKDGCYAICLKCKREVGPEIGEEEAVRKWQEDNQLGEDDGK